MPLHHAMTVAASVFTALSKVQTQQFYELLSLKMPVDAQGIMNDPSPLQNTVTVKQQSLMT